MKTECNYCGKIITNPFIDTDSKGGIYFFCDKEHRDRYEEFLMRKALMLNPIGAMVFAWGILWGFTKRTFKKPNH